MEGCLKKKLTKNTIQPPPSHTTDCLQVLFIMQPRPSPPIVSEGQGHMMDSLCSQSVVRLRATGAHRSITGMGGRVVNCAQSIKMAASPGISL